jgi:hemerythrin-like domain-containing protein
MLGDHERLERLFDELLEALRADARDDAAKLWDDFDSGLRAHLEVEEQEMLPGFAQVDVTEAAALRSEHDTIRDRLTELGVGVDLHETRAEIVDDFRKRLRAHAEREERLLYRWVREGLPEPVKAGIFEQIAATARRIRASREPRGR